MFLSFWLFSIESIFDAVLSWLFNTAQLHSTQPELRFLVGLNPARGVSDICRWKFLTIFPRKNNSSSSSSSSISSSSVKIASDFTLLFFLNDYRLVFKFDVSSWNEVLEFLEVVELHHQLSMMASTTSIQVSLKLIKPSLWICSQNLVWLALLQSWTRECK